MTTPLKLVVLAALLARAAAAQTPLSPFDVRNYHTVKVAEGVYAFVPPDGITPIVSGNSVAIIGDDGVLVVDTGQFPSVTDWEIAQIKALTSQPVRYIVNTHWHPDHWLGNGAFRSAFPGVAILSAPSTREMMMTESQQYIDPKQIAGTRDMVEKVLREGKRPDGSPLSAESRTQNEYGLTQVKLLIPELERVTQVYPTEVFEGSLTVFLGKRAVQIELPGRGNTAGDAIVYVPDTKTMITGDLLVHPYPYAFGSFISEWIEVLGKLQRYDATAIVPGHGVVEYDKAYLAEVSELLQSIQSQVQALVKQGVSLEDARARVDLERYRKVMCADGSTYCNIGFKRSMEAAIGRAYREAKEGKLKDEQ